MLKVFSIDVYDLLDPVATLYFVTPSIAYLFKILPDILDEPYIMSTPVVSRLFQKEYIMLSGRVTYVELV